MQRFFSIIVIFGILLVGGSWILMKRSDEAAKVKRAEELAAARRTFADKARAAANESEEADYTRSIRAALASYQEELKKKVYAKDPEAFDPGAYKVRVDEQLKNGELKEDRHKAAIEGYEIVRGAYDTLMSGNWRSVLTAQSKDIRLDLYDVKRIDSEERPLLEGKLFYWGIEESTRVNWGSLAVRYWKMSREKVKEGGKMVEKDVEKVLGKVEGESTPHILIQDPAKKVEMFPSYVSIGTMWLPVMPRDAVLVDIEIGLVAKTPSGDRDIQLKWEKLPIPDGWRLREGESWNADVVEATEDEIAGKEAAQPPAEE